MKASQLHAFEQLCGVMGDMAKELLYPYYTSSVQAGFSSEQAMLLVRDMARMMLGQSLDAEEDDAGSD